MCCAVPDVNGSLQVRLASRGGFAGLWTLLVLLDLKVSDVPEVY